MKRLLMVCALAGFSFACGDDDGGGDKTNTGNDGGLDSGTTPTDGGGTKTVKVTNVGTACTTANAATTCTGPAATCQTTTLQSMPIPGGSCSAVCTDSLECGTGGNCPIGEAIAFFPKAATTQLGTTGYCTKSCTTVGASCGGGLVCLNLNELTKQTGGTVLLPNDPILTKPFCFPAPTSLGDGGVGDAGAALTLDGGLDGGL